MKARKPLVVGNWKMNPSSAADAKHLFVEIKKGTRKFVKDVDIVIAAPAIYLPELSRLSPSGRIGIGAQNMFYELKGAFTGEISPSMLMSAHVSHVILGHSERRAMGETDEFINYKIRAALKAKLTPIVCIGEAKRDKNGQFYSTIEAQIKAAFTEVAKAAAAKVVIAYEPIWAISKGDGRGKTATTEDVEEMRLFIQKVLTHRFDRATANKISIIYGGSVNAKNCEALTNETSVDGFLPGGASLRPKDFATIVNTLSKRA